MRRRHHNGTSPASAAQRYGVSVKDFLGRQRRDAARRERLLEPVPTQGDNAFETLLAAWSQRPDYKL